MARQNQAHLAWSGIAVAVVIIVVAILFFFFSSSTQQREQGAIDASQSAPQVRSFIEQAPDYEVEAHIPTAQERAEYPVIYGDTQEPVLVQYKQNSQGLLCVVDNNEVVRCFNNVNVG